MSLYEKIVNEYPELTSADFMSIIILRNDSDGYGDYIETWNYEKPIPQGLSLGKSIG